MPNDAKYWQKVAEQRLQEAISILSDKDEDLSVRVDFAMPKILQAYRDAAYAEQMENK